jgi:hypothetical protein
VGFLKEFDDRVGDDGEAGFAFLSVGGRGEEGEGAEGEGGEAEVP